VALEQCFDTCSVLINWLTVTTKDEFYDGMHRDEDLAQ